MSPYRVTKKGNLWLTVNTKTGKVKGRHASKEKAISQMRLLYGVEKRGWKPTGEKAEYLKK